MKHKTKQYARLNLFQRLFLMLVAILTCICILITGSFTLYFRQETREAIDQSIHQGSQINAQNIAQSINQIEMAVSSLNTEQSGLQEKLLLYNDNDDVRSLIVAFNQTIELLNNYVSIALRSFTTKYHVYFFADPSYEMYDHLSVTDIETPSLDGQTWMYSNKKVCDTDWYNLSMESPDQNHWFILENEPDTLCFSRCLNHMTINNNKVETITLGVIFVKMDTSWIQTRLNSSNLTSDTAFLLIDSSGSILYKSNRLTLNEADMHLLISEQHETFMINKRRKLIGI